VKINYWHLISITAILAILKGMGILTCHWAWCFLPVALPFILGLITIIGIVAMLVMACGVALLGCILEIFS
jgi:hypothetical protein